MAFAQFGSTSWADEDEQEGVPPMPAFAPIPVAEEHSEDEVPQKSDDLSDERERGHAGDRPGRGEYQRDDRRSHYREDRREHHREERPRNPVPEEGPFKAHLGNLPFDINEDDIYNFLRVEAVKDIRLIRDEGGKPKGFAYVEFENRDALIAALEANGDQCGGRRIRVDVANERERKPRGRDNSFFSDKRRDRREDGDSRRSSDGVPLERPRLSLAPRSISTGSSGGSEERSKPKVNPFGYAKPRDERAFQERLRERELERKKSLESQSKPREEHHNGKHGGDRPARGRGGGRGHGGRHGGGRGDRPLSRTESRGRGEEGASRPLHRSDSRGRGDAGRGAPERQATTKEQAPPRSKQQEPQRAKRTPDQPPQKAKVSSAPSSVKTTNAFAHLIMEDSDSD